NTGWLYTNDTYDESGKEGEIFKADGTFYGPLQGLYGFGTHGWSGYAVATDSNAVYFGGTIPYYLCPVIDPHNTNTCPASGNRWFGVRRFTTRGDSGPFTDPNKVNNLLGYDHTFLVVNEVTEGTDRSIHGLAAKGGKLYVSDTYGDRVLIYDTSTLL